MPEMVWRVVTYIQNSSGSMGLGWVGAETYPFLFDGWAIGSKHKFLSGEGEICKTGDGEIFVVEVGVVSQDIICLGLG